MVGGDYSYNGLVTRGTWLRGSLPERGTEREKETETERQIQKERQTDRERKRVVLGKKEQRKMTGGMKGHTRIEVYPGL